VIGGCGACRVCRRCGRPAADRSALEIAPRFPQPLGKRTAASRHRRVSHRHHSPGDDERGRRERRTTRPPHRTREDEHLEPRNPEPTASLTLRSPARSPLPGMGVHLQRNRQPSIGGRSTSRYGGCKCVLRRQLEEPIFMLGSSQHETAGSNDRPLECLSRMRGNSHVRF